MRIVLYEELGPLYGIWFSRTHIRRKTDLKSPWYDPDFPKAIKRGARFIGWRDYELETYIASLEVKQPTALPEEHEESPVGKLPSPTTGEVPDYLNK